MNLLSALEYAVEALQLRHIIVCGHHVCGGVRASLTDGTEGLANHWIEPIRRFAHRNARQLVALDEETQIDR